MKRRLKFRPVMTKRVAVTDTKAFNLALAVSHRFEIVETATMIRFTFHKKRKHAR